MGLDGEARSSLHRHPSLLAHGQSIWYWEIHQGLCESVQDWEVNYSDEQDEMFRDKFVFGLLSSKIQTELLKTHCKADGFAISIGDVV